MPIETFLSDGQLRRKTCKQNEIFSCILPLLYHASLDSAPFSLSLIENSRSGFPPLLLSYQLALLLYIAVNAIARDFSSPVSAEVFDLLRTQQLVGCIFPICRMSQSSSAVISCSATSFIRFSHLPVIICKFDDSSANCYLSSKAYKKGFRGNSRKP